MLMKINWTMNQEKNCLTIALEGRIDSTNVAKVEEEVMGLQRVNEGAEIVFDAKKYPSAEQIDLR